MQNRLSDAIDDLQLLTDRRYTGSDIQLSMEVIRDLFGAIGNPFVRDQVLLMVYSFLDRW
jgi:hypothetical protein